MTQYDVAIIGSGPGGYVAAIRCAQLGFKTAVIEKYNTLGGTCLNVGCIPSKALLDSTEHFHNAKTTFQKHGIQLENLKVDFTQMIKRKNEVVKQTCDGVSFLMKKNKIDVLTGVGSFVDAKTISIQNDKGEKQEIEAKHIIIATGSKPASLPNILIDKERIISSTEALTLKEIPKEMIVIGGGVIGCEMASVYARIGTKVRIVEYLPNLIPTMDKDLSKELERVMRKLGVDMHLGFKVKEVMRIDNEVMVSAEDAEGKTHDWSADYCLMAVGRKPFTENLGLEKAGLKTDEKGRITVNENLQTSVENIYAIGDVVRGAMLAHKAEEEGVFVAEFLAGQKPHINYNLIPGVVYTWPEVAAVGNTEEELIKNKTPFKKGSFPFRASGRARASMDLDGFIKILAHAETDEILGVHMIGPRMADLIMEAVVAMEYRASAEDISRMSHPHPTFSEAFREACLAATENRALHV